MPEAVPVPVRLPDSRLSPAGVTRPDEQPSKGRPDAGGTMGKWPTHRNPSPLNTRPPRKITHK